MELKPSAFNTRGQADVFNLHRGLTVGWRVLRPEAIRPARLPPRRRARAAIPCKHPATAALDDLTKRLGDDFERLLRRLCLCLVVGVQVDI